MLWSMRSREFRFLLTALVFALSPTPALGQEPPEGDPAQIEDVLVEGVRLREKVETFVDTVTAPPAGRGPARWSERSGVCVGVVNLRPDAAQAMADRVSEVAREIGLPAGEPGCSPNILIIATDDAPRLAATLVERSPNAFRPPYAGSARSRLQLRRFIDSDRPVRWWHVSMPVDQTGRLAVRVPGHTAPFVPQMASRLNTLVQNDLMRTYVIVELAEVMDLTFQQLTDYVAMVAFTQIDPEADLSSFPTILNAFEAPTAEEAMTDWDRAYLRSLYEAELNRRNPVHQLGGVAAGMFRDRRDASGNGDDVAD